LSGNYLVDNNQLPSFDFTNAALQLAPDAPALYNPDGSINWQLNAAGANTWLNPLVNIKKIYTSKVNNFISNAVISYRIIPGLELKSSFGYTNLVQSETIVAPLSSIQPSQLSTGQRTAIYGNTNVNSWVIEPQLNFKRNVANGKLEILVGTTIQQSNSTLQQLNGSGYNNDAVLQNIGAAAIITGSGREYIYKYNALFGRLNYNWSDKYIIDLTARRDGSSRFGSANEFHNFGAVGLGWVFSDEAFLKRNLSFLSFGKVRGSYGTTGSDQIGDYQFLALYNGPFGIGVPYQGGTALLPNGFANPNLQWEATNKLQFGLDLGFLKDRILINATYYRNRSSNQLLKYNLPINTGFSFVSANLPATIQNSGMELTLNAVTIKAKNFTWTSSFNITTPYNKLISFTNLSTSSYASTYTIGKPFIGLTPVYRYAGVNATTGQYQFYDSKGNLTYSPSSVTDRDTVYTTPKFYGGFENKFSYKGFELDILFQFVNQIANNFFTGYTLPGYYSTLAHYNQPTYLLDRWQKPGDISDHQRFTSIVNSTYTQRSLATLSNAAYTDASYIRLKNLSLSWQFPKSWVEKAYFKAGRIFIQGQNLFTITKYKGGLDPENLSSSVLPPLRVLTIGLQVSL